MDAVVDHLVAIVSVERMQIDDLQAILRCNLLLDRDDAVDDDRVVDVPRRLEGRDGRAEVDLRSGGSALACLGGLCLGLGHCLLNLLRGHVGILLQIGAEREDHLLQILLELRAILPVLGLRVVRAEFDDDHVGIECQRVSPGRLVHVGEVTLVEHRA